MNSNANVRIAVNAILGGRNKEKHMTNFYLRLTPTELSNFTKTTKRLTWMKNWAARKGNTTPANIQAIINKKKASSPPPRKPNSQNTFNKYTNSLEKFMNENMNIEYHSSNNYDEVAAVNLSINKKGYIQIEPVCKNNRSKGSTYIMVKHTRTPGDKRWGSDCAKRPSMLHAIQRFPFIRFLKI
jgi:hypothetical protein